MQKPLIYLFILPFLSTFSFAEKIHTIQSTGFCVRVKKIEYPSSFFTFQKSQGSLFSITSLTHPKENPMDYAAKIGEQEGSSVYKAHLSTKNFLIYGSTSKGIFMIFLEKEILDSLHLVEADENAIRKKLKNKEKITGFNINHALAYAIKEKNKWIFIDTLTQEKYATFSKDQTGWDFSVHENNQHASLTENAFLMVSAIIHRDDYFYAGIKNSAMITSAAGFLIAVPCMVGALLYNSSGSQQLKQTKEQRPNEHMRESAIRGISSSDEKLKKPEQHKGFTPFTGKSYFTGKSNKAK